MATIKDVAKEAGVSIATVSNYLNHTKPVSRKASKAIQTAVDALSYSHNMIARNFRTKQNKDIGVLLPDFSDSYYVQLFQGIKSYFQNKDYYINLEFSRNIPEFEKNIAENFLKKQVCGLILVSCQPDNWKFYYDNFTSRNIPLVLVDRNIHGLDANYVSFNNYRLMKNLVLRLLKEDNKNICLVSGMEEYSCEADCILGFRNACQENGITVKDSMLVQTDMSKEDAFRKTIYLLKNNRPQIIVTTSECLAEGVIEGMTILGYDIEDIPVLTLSEEHWNNRTHSFASRSMARTVIKLGQSASQLLEKQLQSPLTKETERIILSGSCENAGDMPAVFGAGVRIHKVFGQSSPTEEISTRNMSAHETEKLRLLMLDTPQVEAILGIIKNFENQTGISVETTTLPHHLIYEAILENYRNDGTAPYDIFMYDMPWLSSLSSEHILENITKEVEPFKDIFLPKCLEYFGGFQGKYYGIPFMYAPQILYYQKELFQNPELKAAYESVSSISLRPPVTLKEFNTIADFFSYKTDAVRYGISIPAAYSECLAPEIHMRLRAFGGRVFDSRGKVCLDSEQTLKAYINFMRSVKCAKPDYRETTDNSAVQDFLAGETAMLISYPSFLTDITDLRKNSIIGSIGYQMIPGRTPLLGGWGLGINNRSEKKQEAMEFLKWTCDEQIANYSTLLGGQSAVTSAYTNDALANLYPWLPVYHSMCHHTEPTMPPTLQNGRIIPQSEIDDVICKWVYELMDTDMEVLEAIKNTHRELEELVKRYMELKL